MFEDNGNRKCILAKIEHTGFFDERDYSEKDLDSQKIQRKSGKTCMFDLNNLNADQFQAKKYIRIRVAKILVVDFLELGGMSE